MSEYQEQTASPVDFGPSSWQLIQWTIIAFLLLGFGYLYLSQTDQSTVSKTPVAISTNSQAPADANQNFIVVPAVSQQTVTSSATALSAQTITLAPANKVNIAPLTPIATQNNSANSAPVAAQPASVVNNAPTTTSTPVITHTFTITQHEQLATVFKRYGISQQQLEAVMASGTAARQLRYLQLGSSLTLNITNDHQLQSLQYNLSDTQTISVDWIDNHFESQLLTVKPTTQVQFTGVVIQKSLYGAIAKAHLPGRVAYQLEQIFSPEINFDRSIHPGDELRIAYERNYVKGQVVGHGTVVAAELINQHKTYALIGYKNPHGDMEYYTPSGQSLQLAFLRTPLTYFKYVSSPFSMHRLHPILGFVRPHLGVDLAAPSGTPVEAAANSTVNFRGQEHGYGNTIILRYTGDAAYTMLYAHLSRFATDLHQGEYVKKGQIIGYVGQTGLATGPHLHYEVRINGVHYDPLTVALPNAPGISARQYHAFEEYARQVFASLNGVTLA